MAGRCHTVLREALRRFSKGFSKVNSQVVFHVASPFLQYSHPSSHPRHCDAHSWFKFKFPYSQVSTCKKTIFSLLAGQVYNSPATGTNWYIYGLIAGTPPGPPNSPSNPVGPRPYPPKPSPPTRKSLIGITSPEHEPPGESVSARRIASKSLYSELPKTLPDDVKRSRLRAMHHAGEPSSFSHRVCAFRLITS
jgi:hypothetical protein